MDKKKDIKEQFIAILSKSGLTDYEKALDFITALYKKKTNNDSLTKEVIEKNYGGAIKEALSDIVRKMIAASDKSNKEGDDGKNFLTEAEIKVKQQSEKKKEEENPVIKRRNELFLRTGRRKLNNILKDVVLNYVDSDVELSDTIREVIDDVLLDHKSEILKFSEIEDWEQLEEFMDDYLKYLWENPEELRPNVSSDDTAEIDEFYRLVAPKGEDDEEDEEEKRKKVGGKSSHRLITYFITDNDFRNNYASIMKEFAEAWIEKNRTMLGADSIAREFFQEYRDKFRTNIEQDNMRELMEGISKRIETYLKTKNIQDLFDENIDEIRKAIYNILTTLAKDKSKEKIYSKMTRIELQSRIFDLLCMDKNVGGIVSGVPEPTAKEIKMIVKKKFKNVDVFKALR